MALYLFFLQVYHKYAGLANIYLTHAREGSYIPYKTVNDTVDALLAGKSDYAVIPRENTIGGAVVDYIDTLISQEEVSVVGEILILCCPHCFCMK